MGFECQVAIQNNAKVFRIFFIIIFLISTFVSICNPLSKFGSEFLFFGLKIQMISDPK